MKFSHLRTSDYWLLLIWTLPTWWALLLNPGLPNTADGVLHLLRATQLERAWQAGVLYPRIAPDFAYGYGYAIFNYYAPLFYWLVQPFRVTGASFEWSLKAALLLIFYLYPLGMYLWARALGSAYFPHASTTPRSAALAAAVAYLYMPYRFYEAFIQGDYPQFLALAFVPFCLWAVTPVLPATEQPHWRVRLRFFAFVLAYAALMLSHNITALITTPLIGAYILFVLAQNVKDRAQFAHSAFFIGAAIALSVALTAFFWLPALGEQQYVRIERLTQGFFHFEQYFLTLAELLSPNVPPDLASINPYIPFNLGWSLVGVALSGVVALLLLRIKAHVWPLGPFLFLMGLTAASATMTLPISRWLWEHLPLLPLTEFPWRFVGVAAIPLAACVGIAVAAWQQLLSTSVRSQSVRSVAHIPTLIALALIVLDGFVYLFPRTPFPSYGNPQLRDIAQFELDSQAIGTTSAGEYLPRWTQRRMYDSPLLNELRANRTPTYLERETLPSDAVVQTLQQTIADESHRINTPTPALVHTRRIYFPGWRVWVDGQIAPLDLAAPYGTMRVQVPAGEHVVTFQFGATRLRWVADIISGVAMLSFTALCLFRIRSRIISVWPQSARRFLGQLPAMAAKPSQDLGREVRPLRTPSQRARAKHEQATVNAVDNSRSAKANRGAAQSHATPFVLWFGSRPTLLIALLALALNAFYFIAPALGFVRFSSLPDIIGMQQKQLTSVGGELQLLGYDLSPRSITAGESLALTLYWQPLRVLQKSYAVFVHLDDPRTLKTVAETSRAHPGNILAVDLPLVLYVRDAHVLTTTTSVEPGLYLLRVGLVDTRANQALPVTQADGSQRGAVNLQRVRVRRATPPDLSAITHTQVRFGDIELLGYKVHASNLFTLYWRRTASTETFNTHLTVFVHLLDANGKQVATFDAPPTGGLLPIGEWERDEIVVDNRIIAPPAAGPLHIAIGLYDPQTLQRLPAQLPDGQRLPNDAFVLDRTVERKP